MFEIEVGGEAVEADVTFYTGLLYEQEFGGDLVSDFYGVQDGKPMVSGEGELVRVDFTKVSWNAAVKALWAAVKTADDSAPGYRAWARRLGGVDAMEARRLLDEAISDCFFRPGAAGEEASG